jgi:hypothetical protein
MDIVPGISSDVIRVEQSVDIGFVLIGIGKGTRRRFASITPGRARQLAWALIVEAVKCDREKALERGNRKR